ncbi:MAG: mechanosensitive ion channel family protein [Bacillota bacterium]
MEFVTSAWDRFLTEGDVVLWVTSGARVLVIILVAHIATRLVSALIDKTFAVKDRQYGIVDDKRAKTLASLLRSVARYAIDFIAVVTILEVFRIDTKSVLAGAGLIGLAVGFGAQNLVKDIITGFFIVFENQFTVGEFVEAGGVTGVVEEMGLRVTKFRDFTGALHAVPNGTITTSTNWSRGNIRALITVDVAYEENLDRVMTVLERVCEEISREVGTIKEGPKVLGVSDLGASGVSILVLARTEPLEQWGAEREMRLRIKKAFDAEGIEMPYPRRVLVPSDITKVGPLPKVEGER